MRSNDQMTVSQKRTLVALSIAAALMAVFAWSDRDSNRTESTDRPLPTILSTTQVTVAQDSSTTTESSEQEPTWVIDPGASAAFDRAEAPFLQTACRLLTTEMNRIMPNPIESQFRWLLDSVRDSWRNADSRSTFARTLWLSISLWVISFDSNWEDDGFWVALGKQFTRHKRPLDNIVNDCSERKFTSENDRFSSSELGLERPL
jgi:hypothetical protein